MSSALPGKLWQWKSNAGNDSRVSGNFPRRQFRVPILFTCVDNSRCKSSDELLSAMARNCDPSWRFVREGKKATAWPNSERCPVLSTWINIMVEEVRLEEAPLSAVTSEIGPITGMPYELRPARKSATN